MNNLHIYSLSFAILSLITSISQHWKRKHPDQDGEEDKIRDLENRIEELQIKQKLLALSFSVAMLIAVLLIESEL